MAAWCGPCRAFAPVFDKAAEKHPDITFGKIDTEAQQGLAAAFEITSIPTLMVFRDGILLFAEAGALPGAALEELIGQVQKLDMGDVRTRIAEAKAKDAAGGGEHDHEPEPDRDHAHDHAHDHSHDDDDGDGGDGGDGGDQNAGGAQGEGSSGG